MAVGVEQALLRCGVVQSPVAPAIRKACMATALPEHGPDKVATAIPPGVDRPRLLPASQRAPLACRAHNRRLHRPGCGPVATGHDSVVPLDRHGAPTTP